MNQTNASVHPITAILAQRASGVKAGVYSACTANHHVLYAVCKRAAETGGVALIEATANQVNRYGAAKTGRERSANTQSCYVVDPGETTLAEMIASVSNGLLLNRISGGAPASNGDVSAVAKNSFLIRDGKIAGAVTETMLSGNIAAMLKQITAISKERISDGASILPWIKTTGVTISGK